jgi:hypothetical protein
MITRQTGSDGPMVLGKESPADRRLRLPDPVRYAVIPKVIPHRPTCVFHRIPNFVHIRKDAKTDPISAGQGERDRGPDSTVVTDWIFG